MDGTTFRDGIFALHTRRFGSVAEVMIRRLIQCGRGRTLFHDLYDDAAQHRIEVKFSRVQKSAETSISAETVLKCIAEATSLQRMVPFKEWHKHSFDCNIQRDSSAVCNDRRFRSRIAGHTSDTTGRADQNRASLQTAEVLPFSR